MSDCPMAFATELATVTLRWSYADNESRQLTALCIVLVKTKIRFHFVNRLRHTAYGSAQYKMWI